MAGQVELTENEKFLIEQVRNSNELLRRAQKRLGQAYKALRGIELECDQARLCLIREYPNFAMGENRLNDIDKYVKDWLAVYE